MDIKRIKFIKPKNTLRALMSLACIVLTLTVNMPLAAEAAAPQAQTRPTPPLPVPPHVDIKTGPHKLSIPTPRKDLSSNPSDVEIRTARLFEEPLIPMTGAPVAGENASLAEAIRTFASQKDSEDLSAFERFIAAYPQSRWSASLKLNMAKLRFKTGYLTDALSLWSQAWDEAKEEKGREQMVVANSAFADRLILKCRLGRTEEVQIDLAEAAKRPFFGSDEEKIDSGRVGLWDMQNRSFCAFKCGPMALNAIYNLDKKEKTVHPVIEKAFSTSEGTTLAQLKNWADQMDLKYKIAKRSKGAPIITPSVMHWKLNHFAALTGLEGGKYHLRDATFDSDGQMFISAKAIDAETDGYYLIPESVSLPSGWQTVNEAEARSVKGKGAAAAWDGGRLYGDPPKNCQNGQCCEGMAKAEAYAMNGTLNITDTPLSYQAPVGPAMGFQLTYNHSQPNQPSTFTFSNFGLNWNLNWLSYLTVGASNIVTLRVKGGGSTVFTPSGGVYPPDYMDQSQLVNMGGGAWERRLTDGSVEVFNLADTSTPARIFMTEFKDPQGNSVLIQYDSDFRITQITDAINQVSTISYVSNTSGNVGFYKIARITDPFGRHSDFSYDSTTTYLVKITDVVGITSEFSNDTSSSFITSMTTPYGTTSFYKYVPGSNPNPCRGLRFTYPDGTSSVLESWIGELMSSFYWDRHAISLYPNDPVNQVYTHCTTVNWQDNYDSLLMVPSPQSATMPLESSPTIYNYEGTANDHYQGTFKMPKRSTRKLGGNSTLGNLVVNAEVTGTPNVGKVATIILNYETVTYTVQSGDTTVSVANGLAAAINSSSIFRSMGATAGATKNVVSMYSEGPLATVAFSATVSSGSTFAIDMFSQVRQTHELTFGGIMASGVHEELAIYGPWAIGSYFYAVYTTQPGDTFSSVATGLATAINANVPVAQKMRLTAVASGPTLKLQSFSPDPQVYGYGTDGQISGIFSKQRNGNTDTIDYERNAIGKVTKVIDQMRRTTSYSYDTNNIDLLEVRETQEGNNFLLGHWEYNGQHLPIKYIDGSAREWDYVYNASGQPVSVTDPDSNTTTMTYTGTATATVGGSVTTSNVLTITVHDADLSGGQKSINYTVVGGDTLTSIATGLKTAINADTDLAAIGVTATSSGPVITMSSTSVEVTSYTKSTSGGATETITLTANRFGFLTKVDGPLTGSQDISTFSYDNYNRLFTQTDSEGYTLTFYYDDMNRPNKTVYPDGTFEQSVYDKLDAVLTSDRNGRWTQRAYDSLDQLRFEVDPLGRKTQYSWCACGSLASLTDPNGNTTSWQHDLQGRPTVKTYPDSTTVTYAYQSRVSRLKSVTDALGQVKTFFYNPDGSLYQYNFTFPVNLTHASSFFRDYNYPRMTGSQTNGWGGYTYSYNNYVTSSGATPITGGGMLSLVHNDVIANSDISYSYDSLGRTTNRSIDGANNSITWTYDPMSRITNETNELGSFDYAYVDDAPSASKGTTRLASITYPNSQVTKFNYFDNIGDQRLQQISNLNPSGASLSQFNYRYDPAGQITQWQQIQNNMSTTYALGYDKAGQLTTAQAAGGVLSPAYLKQNYYAYDLGSNRTAVHANSVTRAKLGGTVTTSDVLTITVVDPALTGGQKAVAYTTVGGDTLTTIATKLAAAITADTDLQTLGVNASSSGSVISIKSVSRNITTYTKTTSGGATETIALNVTDNFVENAVIGGAKTTGDVLTINVIDPALGGGSQSINYTVLSGDNLTSIATGLKTAINANGSLSAIGVAATSAGTAITIKSTSSNATTYDQSVSNGATETIGLSVNQNVIETIAIGGSKTTSDTITVVVYDAGLPGGTDSTVYTVQSGDTLSSIASGIATALNADSDLQAIGASATASGTIVTLRSNSINPTTYRATTSASATETATIGIPSNGVQTAIVGGSKTTSDVLTITAYDAGLPGGSKAVSYTVLGGDTLTSIAAGLATAINADTDWQAQAITATSSSTVLNISSASKNLTTYTKTLSGGATETLNLAPGINVTAYGHNNVNELTSIASGGATRFLGNSNKALLSATVNGNSVPLNWSHEFEGNATTSAGTNNVPVVITDGASNTNTKNYQVTVNSGSSATLTYDANGNMTGDGTNTYVWDAENRLIRIDYPGMGNNSQFTFDAYGQNTRIVEVASGSTVSTAQFIWMFFQRSEERDNSGVVTKQFFGGGEKIGSNSYFYTKDDLHSIREIVDGAGDVQGQVIYDPFGRTQQQGSLIPDFQYTKHYFHPRSGLNLTRNRSLSSSLGRWLSRDFLEKYTNLYAYVENNPVSFIDPLGLFTSGNWCGGGYTSGGNGPQGESNPGMLLPGDDGFVLPDPKVPWDKCCYDHDICTHRAHYKDTPKERKDCACDCDNQIYDCLKSMKKLYWKNHAFSKIYTVFSWRPHCQKWTKAPTPILGPMPPQLN